MQSLLLPWRRLGPAGFFFLRLGAAAWLAPAPRAARAAGDAAGGGSLCVGCMRKGQSEMEEGDPAVILNR